MQFEERTYTLPTWAIQYIEYGNEAIHDFGGITEEEAQEIDAWIQREGLNRASWQYGEDEDFSWTNDIRRGEGGTVIEATAFIPLQN